MSKIAMKSQVSLAIIAKIMDLTIVIVIMI